MWQAVGKLNFSGAVQHLFVTIYDLPATHVYGFVTSFVQRANLRGLCGPLVSPWQDVCINASGWPDLYGQGGMVIAICIALTCKGTILAQKCQAWLLWNPNIRSTAALTKLEGWEGGKLLLGGLGTGSYMGQTRFRSDAEVIQSPQYAGDVRVEKG